MVYAWSPLAAVHSSGDACMGESIHRFHVVVNDCREDGNGRKEDWNRRDSSKSTACDALIAASSLAACCWLWKGASCHGKGSFGDNRLDHLGIVVSSATSGATFLNIGWAAASADTASTLTSITPIAVQGMVCQTTAFRSCLCCFLFQLHDVEDLVGHFECHWMVAAPV